MTRSTEATAVPRPEGADVVADRIRSLIDAAVRAGSAMDSVAEDLCRSIEEVTSRIEALAPGTTTRMAEIWEGDDRPRADPSSGTENPLAPPLVLSQHPDGSVRGTVTLGLPYQGPRGFVHGGVSALMLDHALGVANSRAGTAGMTAVLTIRYRRPTPLGTELTVVARRTSVDGRKIRAAGEIRSGDDVLVEADGVWVMPRTAGADADGVQL